MGKNTRLFCTFAAAALAVTAWTAVAWSREKLQPHQSISCSRRQHQSPANRCRFVRTGTIDGERVALFFDPDAPSRKYYLLKNDLFLAMSTSDIDAALERIRKSGAEGLPVERELFKAKKALGTAIDYTVKQKRRNGMKIEP